MSEFTQKTLAEITRKNIHPIPFWVTWLRNSAYWMGAIVLVLFSALATGASFHAVSEIDWDAYAKADFSWLQTILSGAPLFLMVFIALFFWMTLYFFHQTRYGYRYPTTFLVAIFFSTSVVFGYFIERSPLDEPAENFLLYALPHVDTLPTNLIPTAARQWSQPEKGLLGGTVVSSNDTDFQLIDTSEKLWTVEYSSAEIAPDTSLEPDEAIKVIGNQEGDDAFTASEIRDWKKSKAELQKEERTIERKKKAEREKEQEKQKKEEEKQEREEEDHDDEDSSSDEDEDEHEDEDDNDSHDED